MKRRPPRSTLFPYTDALPIYPPTLSVPTGYTHVVQVHSGRTVYIAGQVSFDKSGNLVGRSEEHTSELQSHSDLVCRLLLEKKKRTARPAYGTGARSPAATRHG